MFKSIYTEEEHAFMKEYVSGHTLKEIQEEFIKRFGWEITTKQIRGYLGNHNLNTGMGKFKSGQSSYKRQPIGSESVDCNGLIKVKVENPSKWRYKHNVVWEKHNGTIPSGCVIIFLDGNDRNFDINNLECVTRAENLYLNRHAMRFQDPELTKTAINIARLQCKAFERKKHK